MGSKYRMEDENKDFSEINIIPLVDVMLVLLILYHQPSLIASVGAISMIVNGIHVAKKIQNGI